MLTRLSLAVLLATTALTRAQTADLPTSVEATGNAVRGCIGFSSPLDAGADSHPGDWLGLSPAVEPAVSVAGGQLCLDGLAWGTRYAVTIGPGLRFADGTVAPTGHATIETPDRDPAVAIAGRGWILPRQGTTGVTVQTMNVPRVRIRVLRLAAAPLAARLPAVTERYDMKIDPRKQQFTLYELQSLAANAATEIWSGTMQTVAARNRAVETAFPLAGIVDPAKPGAYLVLAEDASHPAAKLVRDPNDRYDFAATVAGHWLLNTNLAISSLQGQDGLHVTVRSLASAVPLPGVRLQLLSLAQDVLGEAVTDGDGAAVFAPGLLRGKLGAAAAVVMARTGDDMVLQDLTAPAFDLSDRGAEGRVSPGPVEAYVYTDRGIYRPGETVQVTALLRTQGLSAVDAAGLTLVLRRPDGVESSRLALPPAPDAGFVQPMALSKTAAQGGWTIEAYLDPSLPPIGRATLAVQDFVPQQLKVAVTGPRHACRGRASDGRDRRPLPLRRAGRRAACGGRRAPAARRAPGAGCQRLQLRHPGGDGPRRVVPARARGCRCHRPCRHRHHFAASRQDRLAPARRNGCGAHRTRRTRGAADAVHPDPQPPATDRDPASLRGPGG